MHRQHCMLVHQVSCPFVRFTALSCMMRAAASCSACMRSWNACRHIHLSSGGKISKRRHKAPVCRAAFMRPDLHDVGGRLADPVIVWHMNAHRDARRNHWHAHQRLQGDHYEFCTGQWLQHAGMPAQIGRHLHGSPNQTPTAGCLMLDQSKRGQIRHRHGSAQLRLMHLNYKSAWIRGRTRPASPLCWGTEAVAPLAPATSVTSVTCQASQPVAQTTKAACGGAAAGWVLDKTFHA